MNMNLRMSTSSVALLKMYPLLKPTLFLPLKLRTFLQRELLLQRELVR